MVRRVTFKKRGVTTRVRKKIILIGCEGDNKTEKSYFTHFNSLQDKYSIVFAKGSHTDPKGVVDDLIKAIKSTELDLYSGDIAACFIDVDILPDKIQQLDTAIKLAKDNDIQMYLSNPRFEVWFLLHYRYSTKQYSSNDELMNEMKQYINEYKKSTDIFNMVYPMTSTAIINAKRLDDYHTNQRVVDKYKRIPYTDVYKLVEEILNCIIFKGGGDS